MFDSLKICFCRNVKQFKTTAPMKVKKTFCDLIMKIKSCGTRSLFITFPKTYHFLEKCINTCHNNQKIKIKSVKANILKVNL